MTSNIIWLEVNNSNGAIMSYCLQIPTTPSIKCDYVEATQDELIFLNALEDAVFAPGMVATLADLLEHRARVQVAKKAKATSPAKPAATSPKQPAKAASKASNTNAQTTNPNAKERFIAALKQHRPRKLL